MEKVNLIKSLKEINKNIKKRNFKQTLDFIVVLKNIDLKKNENQFEFFVPLPHEINKVKICGLVGQELSDQSKKVLDKTIIEDQFEELAKDKKLLKKLADEFDFFIAQGNIMAKVAKSFGKVFGPRGKMPNPKAGCVVPPNANLEVLKNRLSKLKKVSVKKQPLVQLAIGKEEQKEEEVVENILSLYKYLLNNLKEETNNIKKIMLKYTMDKPYILDFKGNLLNQQNNK